MRDVLYVKNKFIENGELSDTAFCILVSLIGVTHKNCDKYCMNYNAMGYNLFGRLPSLREKDRIVSAIEELVDKKYIKIDKKLTKTDLVYDLSCLHGDEKSKYYVAVRTDELQKIMNIDTLKDRYKIFRVFVSIINTFNKSSNIDAKYKGKIGFMNQSYLSQTSNINVETLREYSRILEENNLIYIVRHSGDFKKNKDHNGIARVKGITNTYSRYEDRKICDEYAGKVKGNKKTMENKIAADSSRSLKQKYNYMLKGKEYPIEVVTEIYEHIKEVNIKKSEKDEELLDMSIFEKYMLI